VLFFGELPPRLLLVAFAPLPFSLLSYSFGASLLAEDRPKAYAASLWIRNAGTALVLAWSLRSPDRLSFILAGRLGVNAFVALVTALLARARPAWREMRRLAPAALRYGGPTALSSGAVAVHRRADVLLLSAYGRVGEIGAYSLAAAFAEAFWLVTDSFENALFVNVARRSAPDARAEARRAFRFALWLGAAGFVLGTAGGETAIRLFFGDRHPAAAGLLPWLLAATIAWGIARPFYSFLSSQGFVSTVLACNVLGLAVNLAACLLAIPRFGATGAAVACLASYGALLAAFGVAFRLKGGPRAVAARPAAGNF
jgi:O-antigen/teichoic acid export membrane protein